MKKLIIIISIAVLLISCNVLEQLGMQNITGFSYQGDKIVTTHKDSTGYYERVFKEFPDTVYAEDCPEIPVQTYDTIFVHDTIIDNSEVERLNELLQVAENDVIYLQSQLELKQQEITNLNTDLLETNNQLQDKILQIYELETSIQQTQAEKQHYRDSLYGCMLDVTDLEQNIENLQRSAIIIPIVDEVLTQPYSMLDRIQGDIPDSLIILDDAKDMEHLMYDVRIGNDTTSIHVFTDSEFNEMAVGIGTMLKTIVTVPDSIQYKAGEFISGQLFEGFEIKGGNVEFIFLRDSAYQDSSQFINYFKQ